MRTFLQAIEQSDVTHVLAFIQEGIDVNQPCSNGYLPLKIAIDKALSKNVQHRENSLLVIDQLLQAGANPNLVDSAQNSLLHQLSLAGCDSSSYRRSDDNDIEKKLLAKLILEKLLKFKPDLEISDNDGNTPLLCAVQHNNTAAVELLMQAGANIRISNYHGNTLLHYAASHGDRVLVDHLLAQGIELNIRDKQNQTPLDWAHDPETVLMLLKQNAKANRQDMLYFFNLAQSHNHTALIDYLLAHDIATYRGLNGDTALNHANSYELTQRLLAHGADVKTNINVILRKLSSRQHHHDDENTFIKYLSLYRQYGFNLAHHSDSNGNTLLHLCIYDSKAIVEALLALQVPINAQNAQGETALHLAMAGANLDMAQLLLAKNADATLKNAQGELAIEKLTYMNASSRKDFSTAAIILTEILQRLLAACSRDHLPKNLQDLLLLASYYASLPLLEVLYQLGAVIQRKVEQNDVFSVAIQQDQVPILRWLLRHTIDNIDVIKADLLCLAVSYYKCKCVKFLLTEIQADPNQWNSQGKLPINCFIDNLCYPALYFQNNEEAAQAIRETLHLLKSAGVNFNQRNQCGKTCLEEILASHNAAHYWEMISFLLARQVDLPQHKTNLQTLVWLAAINKDKAAFTNIIDRCQPHLRQDLLVEAAFIAAQGLDSGFFGFLLEKGFPINQPLKPYNCPECYLLEKVLNLTSVYTDRELTAEAFESKRIAFLQYLVSHGIKLHVPRLQRDKGYSFFHQFVALGYTEVVNSVLSHDFNFPIDLPAGVYKETALQIAVKKGHYPLVKLLLERGANPHVLSYSGLLNHSGETLLHLACLAGNLPILELLLACTPIDRDAVGIPRITWLAFPSESGTAIYYAATHQKPEIAQAMVSLLLQCGAAVSVTLLDTLINQNFPVNILKHVINKVTPEALMASKTLHTAVIANHLEACKLLLSYCPSLLNLKDARGRIPLHHATAPDRQAIYHYLVQAGADLTACDFAGADLTIYAICNGTYASLAIAIPQGFCLPEFIRLRANLIEQPEFAYVQNAYFTLSECCYKLIYLFNNCEQALTFIKRYKDPHSRQPIHDLCLFQLPLTGQWHTSAWASLLMAHGLTAIKYLPLAPRIEQLLTRPPASLEEVVQYAARIRYSRETDNPTLAELFHRHHIPEAAFNRVLDTYRPKDQDKLPNITIDGAEFGEPRFYLKKLAADDPRGFVLGTITHCCQSVGAAGESCAMHGMMSAYGGFYVVFKRAEARQVQSIETLLALAQRSPDTASFFKGLSENAQKDKLPKAEQKRQYQKYQKLCAAFKQKRRQFNAVEPVDTEIMQDLRNYFIEQQEGEMVAQCWAWLSTRQALVLDSWERLRAEDDRLCEPFVQRLAIQAIKHFNIPKVLIGKDGQTPLTLLPFKLSGEKEVPKDYVDYRDSQEQLCIACREDLLLQIDDISTASNKDSAQQTQVLNTSVAQLTQQFGLFNVSKQIQPAVTQYTPTQIDQLLGAYLTNHAHILLLPALTITEVKMKPSDWLDKQLQEVKHKHKQQAFDYFCLLPILNAETHWTCLVLHVGQTEGYDNFNKWLTWMAIDYIDFSGNPVPQAISQLLLFHSNLRTLNAIYNTDPDYSGIWLVETLRHFAKEGILFVPPVHNTIQLSFEEHQTLLQTFSSGTALSYQC